MMNKITMVVLGFVSVIIFILFPIVWCIRITQLIPELGVDYNVWGFNLEGV